MLSLAETQGNFIDTINKGPDALHPSRFAGPADRIMLGLKAHANTISHARLVALEETFPLTRQKLGDEAFNRLSRDFVETPEARATDANDLGRDFPAFLKLHRADRSVIDLASIEWAWLQSYHAAEAKALALADLSALAETAMLAMPVALHPAAHYVRISAPLASTLEELAGQQPAAVLALRPDAEVRLLGIDDCLLALLLPAAQKNCTLGNLLALAVEQSGEQAPLEPLLHLIGAGALVKAG